MLLNDMVLKNIFLRGEGNHDVQRGKNLGKTVYEIFWKRGKGI